MAAAPQSPSGDSTSEATSTLDRAITPTDPLTVKEVPDGDPIDLVRGEQGARDKPVQPPAREEAQEDARPLTQGQRAWKATKRVLGLLLDQWVRPFRSLQHVDDADGATAVPHRHRSRDCARVGLSQCRAPGRRDAQRVVHPAVVRRRHLPHIRPVHPAAQHGTSLRAVLDLPRRRGADLLSGGCSTSVHGIGDCTSYATLRRSSCSRPSSLRCVATLSIHPMPRARAWEYLDLRPTQLAASRSRPASSTLTLSPCFRLSRLCRLQTQSTSASTGGPSSGSSSWGSCRRPSRPMSP